MSGKDRSQYLKIEPSICQDQILNTVPEALVSILINNLPHIRYCTRYCFYAAQSSADLEVV